MYCFESIFNLIQRSTQLSCLQQEAKIQCFSKMLKSKLISNRNEVMSCDPPLASWLGAKLRSSCNQNNNYCRNVFVLLVYCMQIINFQSYRCRGSLIRIQFISNQIRHLVGCPQLKQANSSTLCVKKTKSYVQGINISQFCLALLSALILFSNRALNHRVQSKYNWLTGPALVLTSIIILQMEPVIKNIFIDFQSMPGTNEERNYHKEVFSAIKLSFADMEKYQKTSHFNHCDKCKMVLTVQDKACVYDWEEISSNLDAFKDVLEKCKQDQDKLVWICSFCQNKNVLSPLELKFARNNSRVVDRPGDPTQKKDPILLVVFDISGSMDEVLSHDQSTYSSLVDKIKKTKIYQKIVADEQKEIQQLCEKQSIKLQGNSKIKYTDYLKKNKLLMSLTESIVTEFLTAQNAPVVATVTEKMGRIGTFAPSSKASSKNTSKTSVKEKKSETRSPKTIGFIFFNSNVILEPCNRQEKYAKVIVCDTHGTFSSKGQDMSRERVNFDDFESLFKLGANYGNQYEAKINEFDFTGLDYNFSDCTSGQTALGPAIVIAAGVISQHGPGSSIVVVTDGIGNKGIFDQSERWEQPLKLLKLRLQKHRCFLTVLQCRNNGEDREKEHIKTCIDQFCQRYDESIAKKINVLLNKNKTADHLIDDIQAKMKKTLVRTNGIWTNEVIIKSQNSNFTFTEDSRKLSERLQNSISPIYIKPEFESRNLKEKDYIHHFMTQAVIKYEDTQTGEQSTFLTYVMKKIIKYDSIRQSTINKLDNQATFHDVLEYLSAEEENYDISNMPLGFVRKTFRDTLMFSKSICNRSMRFSSRSIEHKQDQDNFFFDIHQKAQEHRIQEQDEDEEQF